MDTPSITDNVAHLLQDTLSFSDEGVFEEAEATKLQDDGLGIDLNVDGTASEDRWLRRLRHFIREESARSSVGLGAITGIRDEDIRPEDSIPLSVGAVVRTMRRIDNARLSPQLSQEEVSFLNVIEKSVERASRYYQGTGGGEDLRTTWRTLRRTVPALGRLSQKVRSGLAGVSIFKRGEWAGTSTSKDKTTQNQGQQARQRTNAEKRAEILSILKSPQAETLTNRAIARFCQVHHSTVSTIRANST